ncbi:MAG: 5-histidylcysteine sulfoxide synthase [Aureispira sp.]|nr:5-histidylcysteine sulfoxide synthase [Aureispira sp.]
METLSPPQSLHPVLLNNCTREELDQYFCNTWELYDWLFSSIKDESTYYINPDPLRHPLIFYWGHTAAFYINKLILAGLLKEGINEYYEDIFAKGVDPDLPENLETQSKWPNLADVDAYRKTVYNVVREVIATTPLEYPINEKSALWALFMGLEHDRIHFETSSVLIRQAPAHLLQRPDGWEYAVSSNTNIPENKLIRVEGGKVSLGKPQDSTIYGWDNEYGSLEVEVKPFEATQNLISNQEYLEFVRSGAYSKKQYWTAEGWNWKQRTNTKHPKFWVIDKTTFNYRAMFDVVYMPLDYPVEVNAHEAWAYCKWKGDEWRLLSEAEFMFIAKEGRSDDYDPVFDASAHNLNMFIGSPTPVGQMKEGQTVSGFNDIYGNVWDWLKDDWYALPDFKTHPWYTDFSEPYFDTEHSMMLGGAWATTGTGASRFYRLWFRREFYQHAGFRMAKNA